MGEENGVQNSILSPEALNNKDEGTKEVFQVPAPTFGFDEKGTFFLQIHSKAGFLAMMGFLYKATLWMNARMDEYEAKKKSESLIKPSNKGFGRFNLFK